MKVAIYTLGCKVNQYETQAMEQSLRARGHEVVDFSDAADAYVVNTCSVTAVSDQKSRQVVHRVKKQRPEAVVAVPEESTPRQLSPSAAATPRPMRTMCGSWMWT